MLSKQNGPREDVWYAQKFMITYLQLPYMHSCDVLIPSHPIQSAGTLTTTQVVVSQSGVQKSTRPPNAEVLFSPLHLSKNTRDLNNDIKDRADSPKRDERPSDLSAKNPFVERYQDHQAAECDQ